jgi:tetratricopeptide (TPR) repeat protein
MRMHLVSAMETSGLLHHVGLAVLLALAPLMSRGQEKAPPPARANTQEERQRAVRELHSKDFAVREAATYFLWQCGLVAKPLLEPVAAGNDPEASKRASNILKRFAKRDVGKLPPDRASRLGLLAWEGAKYPPRAVKELLKEQPTDDELRDFLLAIPDMEKRRLAVASLSADTNHLLRLALKHGPKPAESLLRTAASSGDPDAVRRWVAYLIVTNRVEKALGELEKRLDAGKLPDYKKPLLSALRYAAGNHKKALELAEQIDYDDVKLSMAARREDWITLGELLASKAENDVARLAIRSHAARLAGKDELADKLLGQTLERAKESKSGEAEFCHNLLFLQNRIGDVLKLPRTSSDHVLLRALQPRKDGGQSATPLPVLPIPTRKPLAARNAESKAKLQAAFDGILKRKGLTDSELTDVIRKEQDQGFHELALRHAAQVVSAHRAAGTKDQGKIDAAIQAPFRPATPASRLFRAMELASPDAAVPELMQHLSELLHYDSPVELVQQLLKEGMASSIKPKSMPKADWYLLLAEICWTRNLDSEAIDCIKNVPGASRPWLRLAKSTLACLPEEQRIPFARSAAQAALKQDNEYVLSDAIDLLAACDLLDPDEGSSTKRLYPFLATRHNGRGAHEWIFSRELKLLGGTDNVGMATGLERYHRLPGSLGSGDMWHPLIEEERFAEALKATRFWELRLAGRRGFAHWGWGSPMAAYLRAQISILLGLGKREEAKRLVHLPAFWAIDPDDAIALRKTFADAGMAEEADHVFRTAYLLACRIVEVQSLSLREPSHLAWLCACSGEELEKARRYIDSALEYEPLSAPHQDTLAQILAAQGKLDEAIAAQRRAVLLSPWGGFDHDYRDPLRRYIQQKAQQEEAKGR